MDTPSNFLSVETEDTPTMADPTYTVCYRNSDGFAVSDSFAVYDPTWTPPAGQTARTDLPHPAAVLGDPEKVGHQTYDGMAHRWTGSAWELVPEPP